MEKSDSYVAHSPRDSQKGFEDFSNEFEELKVHSKNVAATSKAFSALFDFAELGNTIGLLHDIGKYQKAFQDKIKGKNIDVEKCISF